MHTRLSVSQFPCLPGWSSAVASCLYGLHTKRDWAKLPRVTVVQQVWLLSQVYAAVRCNIYFLSWQRRWGVAITVGWLLQAVIWDRIKVSGQNCSVHVTFVKVRHIVFFFTEWPLLRPSINTETKPTTDTARRLVGGSKNTRFSYAFPPNVATVVQRPVHTANHSWRWGDSKPWRASL